MPTRPYRERHSTFHPSSKSLHERINDPEIPTSIAEVVVDISKEEDVSKRARKRERLLVPIVTDPCAASPTTAHWWVYPASYKKGQPWCRYCGEYK